MRFRITFFFSFLQGFRHIALIFILVLYSIVYAVMMQPVMCFDAYDIVVIVQREKKKRELVQVEANIQRIELRLKVGQVGLASTFSSPCFVKSHIQTICDFFFAQEFKKHFLGSD